MSDTYYVDIGQTVTTYYTDDYRNPICEECQGKGIFYFTGEERLEDSQPCGECHGKGWIYD